MENDVIRCKDCIHIRKWRSEESAKKFGQIYECAYGVLMSPFPDDFCSKAERKMPSRKPEVIHCKDCIFKELHGSDFYCDHITGEEILVKPDDFCSWAKR